MIRISRDNRIVRSVVTLTPSKSITNRVLILQALSNKKFEIRNAADAEDSKVLSSILSNLPNEIDAGDAGTAFRFLTAFLSIQKSNYVLTGSQRMKQRPVGELVHALRDLGARIEFNERENYPPLKIMGGELKGGKIAVNASESSQFISALLLIAPKLKGGLWIELSGKINSRPYISMTVALLEHFGITVNWTGSVIHVPQQEFIPQAIAIENDWSSASFWYLIAALSDEAEVVLKDLSMNSIQGDTVISKMMESFDVDSKQVGKDVIIRKSNRRELPVFFEHDFSDCPDLVIPMAVLCAGRKVPAKFTGVKNLRIKESDRLLAIREELEKFGVEVRIESDSISLDSFSGKRFNKLFHSHFDHRMIMSLATLALVFDQIVIDNHLEVNKSYPGYWKQLQDAGFLFETI